MVTSSPPIEEPFPGMYQRGLHQARLAYRRRKNPPILEPQLDEMLSVDDVYGQCPYKDVISSRPPYADWWALQKLNDNLEIMDTTSARNEWGRNLVNLAFERATPKKRSAR